MIQLILLEFLLVALSILVSFLPSRLSPAIFGAIERRFVRFARRKGLAVLAAGIAAAIAGGVPRLFQGLPRPQQYDEFSYLLAADTFAHGHVTNPTHPMWRHFESFHIIQRPTYMSMYPPGQGLVLAAGRVLFGHPWFGVWLSVSLMCAAIVWMLQAWLPPGWALFGGFLAVVRIACFSYWIESYWGGAVAALGGALLLGALPRLMRSGRFKDSILLGAGMAILANTRPFEGGALILAVAGTLAVWMFRDRSLIRKLVPAAALVCCAGAAMLYYNWRITGDSLALPYSVNRAQYAVAQVFTWQHQLPVPSYRHKVMHDFYTGWELTGFNISRGWSGYEISIYEKIFKAWMFFVGPLLTIAMFPLWRVMRDRRLRPLIIIGGISGAIVSTAIYANPHYWAPYTALIYAVLLQGLRHVRNWQIRRRPIGVGVTRAIPLICLAMVGFRSAAQPLKLPLILGVPTWCSRFTPDYRREDLIVRLKQMGSPNLVMVRYAPDHVPHEDWVYNDADIDGSPVVWAREMDPASNAELIRYFHGRRVWLLEPDRDVLKLTTYSQ